MAQLLFGLFISIVLYTLIKSYYYVINTKELSIEDLDKQYINYLNKLATTTTTNTITRTYTS